MWNLPRSGIKPMSSALAGGFLSIGSPEKTCISLLKRRSTPSALSVLSQWLTPYSFNFNSLLSFCKLLFWRSWSLQSGNQSYYVVSSLPQLLHGTDASDHPSLAETHSPCLCDEVFLLILLLIHPSPFSLSKPVITSCMGQLSLVPKDQSQWLKQ